MKVWVSILLLLFSSFGFSQVLPFRGDTIRLYKQGGSAELLLENATRNQTGPLVNIGGGKTRFSKPRMINDSVLVIGVDSVIIPCVCRAVVVPAFSFLTQPTNKTDTVGASVPFYFKVQNGTGPYKYQIHNLRTSSTSTTSTETLDNYTFFPTATETENYNFTAIDLGGNDTILSNTVTLTVSAPAPTITYGYSASDPYVDNSTIPTISNSASITITSGANLSLSFPAGAVDKYMVIKIPVSQPTPTIWYSTSFNNGTIPDATFRTVFTIGSFKYVISRDGAGVAFDYTVPFQFNH